MIKKKNLLSKFVSNPKKCSKIAFMNLKKIYIENKLKNGLNKRKKLYFY